MLHASNFETFNAGRVREELEGVSDNGGHQEVVRSTVEVAMVIMAPAALLRGMPVAAVLEKKFFFNGRMSTRFSGIVQVNGSI